MGSADSSEYLCMNGKRLGLWAVAELVFPNFKKKGLPIRKPGVLFRPIVERDFRQAARILNLKSAPVKGTPVFAGFLAKLVLIRPTATASYAEGFWASRWMGNQSLADDEVDSTLDDLPASLIMVSGTSVHALLRRYIGIQIKGRYDEVPYHRSQDRGHRPHRDVGDQVGAEV